MPKVSKRKIQLKRARMARGQKHQSGGQILNTEWVEEDRSGSPFGETIIKMEDVVGVGQDLNDSSSSSLVLENIVKEEEEDDGCGSGVMVPQEVKGYHTSHLKYSKNGIKNGDEGGFACGRCGGHFSQWKDLLFHNRFEGDCSKNREMYPCPICGFKFVTQLRLDNHFRLSHPGQGQSQGQSLSCTKCSKNFLQRSELVQHLNLHDRYTCPVQDCGGEFQSKKTLNIHLLSHHQPLPQFPCQLCPQKYTTKESLQVHKTWSHKKVNCQNCGKTFANKKTLETHTLKYHHNSEAGSLQSSTNTTRYKESIRNATSPSISSRPEVCPNCSREEAECKCGLVLDIEIEDVKLVLKDELDTQASCDFLEFTSNTDESRERYNPEEILGLLPLDQDLEECNGHVNYEEEEDPLLFL